MSVSVRLYGKLRIFASELDSASETIGILKIDDEVKTVSDVIRVIGIEEDNISHIFLNGEYSGLNRAVSPGDRLALFPENMGLLYKWYFKEIE